MILRGGIATLFLGVVSTAVAGTNHDHPVIASPHSLRHSSAPLPRHCVTALPGRAGRALRTVSLLARTVRWPGRVDEFDAEGHDADGFVFGWIDLSDVRELVFA